jgi:hypothetical protein
MNEGIRLKVEGRREYVSFEMGFDIIWYLKVTGLK